MIRTTIRWTALPVGVLLMGMGIAAQEKPNFSGRWVIVSPAEGAGEEQFVKHDGNKLTVGHDSTGGGHYQTYVLDGTETRNVLVSHGQDIVTLSKAVWNGSQLTITSATTYPDGRRMDSKQVWALDGDGRLLIEHTETTPGKPATTTKAVLTKRT